MNSIIEALERSSLLQLSPDKRKVKRATPVSSESDSHGDATRSVYIVNTKNLIHLIINLRKTSQMKVHTKTSKNNSVKSAKSHT